MAIEGIDTATEQGIPTERQLAPPIPGWQRRQRRLTAASATDKVAVGLGWFSIGVGLAESIAPGRFSKWMGVRYGNGLIRSFGAREIMAGTGLLTRQHRAPWMWARVAGDAFSIAALGAAMGQRRAKRGRTAVALAAVAGVTALDIACARALSGSGAAVRVRRTLAVNAEPDVLYRFWRDFENLPRFMNHLKNVNVLDQRRSRWLVKAPAGMRVEWDAEITEDRPGELIAWRSAENAQVENSGSVRFMPAPGNRGTFVSVEIEYKPPAGEIGAMIAKLFGEGPEQQVRCDLRRFKQLVETGEIATTEGQTSGRRSPMYRAFNSSWEARGVR